MYQYRLLFSFGLAGFAIALVDAVVNQSWAWLLAALIYNLIFNTYLGNTIALHRYISHRSFKTTPFKHRLLCFLSMIPGHGSPINFTILHRHHHVHSDQDLDTHSPQHGFFHSWLIYGLYGEEFYIQKKKVRAFPKELARDPTIKFIHKYYYHMMFGTIALTALVDWRMCVYFVLLPIALAMWDNFYLSYVSHVKWFPGNYRNFESNDRSHNNKYAALVHAAAYHHNHHVKPNAYNEAMMPGEFDPAAWVIDKFFIEHQQERQHKI